MSRWALWAAGLAAAIAVVTAAGCARGGEEAGPVVPQAVLDLWVRFAGPVDESAYYFVALDRDGDFGEDFPVPIAAGPFWANGWGTGSISHFMEYHLDSYQTYQANLIPVLREAEGGVAAVGGVPQGNDAGQYTLTIGPVLPGSVIVSGAGMVQAATNVSGQNAGALALETDAEGKPVPGSVSFTPAADGGRMPNGAEQAQINALNAGAVTLSTDSLSAFGLQMTLGLPTAATQTLQIGPAEANVQTQFVPAFSGASRTWQATLRANSSTPSATPPIPGTTITTTTLVTGAEPTIDVEVSQTPLLIGPPFSFVPPVGATVLQAQIDLADLGPNLDNISLNIITTTELIFDPTIADPDRHCYDGLGPLGNDAITLPAGEFRTYSNATTFIREDPDDVTLQGPVTEQQRDAVDIVDWRVSVTRLR